MTGMETKFSNLRKVESDTRWGRKQWCKIDREDTVQEKRTLTQLPRHWTRIGTQYEFLLTRKTKVHRSVLCTDIMTYQKLDRGINTQL